MHNLGLVTRLHWGIGPKWNHGLHHYKLHDKISSDYVHMIAWAGTCKIEKYAGSTMMMCTNHSSYDQAMVVLCIHIADAKHATKLRLLPERHLV